MASPHRVNCPPMIDLDPRAYSRGKRPDKLNIDWRKHRDVLEAYIKHHVGVGTPYSYIARGLGFPFTAVQTYIGRLNKRKELPTKGSWDEAKEQEIREEITCMELQRRINRIPCFETKASVLHEIDDQIQAYFMDHPEERERYEALMGTKKPKTRAVDLETVDATAAPDVHDEAPEPLRAPFSHVEPAAVEAPAAARRAPDPSRFDALAAIAHQMIREAQVIAEIADDDMSDRLIQAIEDWKAALEPVAPYFDRKALLARLQAMPENDLRALMELAG